MHDELIRRLVPRPIRNALRSPSKTAKRVAAKFRFAFGQVAELEPLPGWRLRCHPLSVEQFLVFHDDPEQASELKDFISFSCKGMRLLDVGSHWGFFSMAALHIGGSEARVLAIEASQAAAKVLEHNIRLNGLNSRTKIIIAAAGAAAGTIKMLTTGAGGADYFVVPSGIRKDTIDVHQVSISEVCVQHRFAPTHIKMDVEGFEEEALRGAQACIYKHKPVIFLELHGDLIRRRELNPNLVLDLLAQLGYHRFVSNGKPITRLEIERCGFNVRMVCFPESLAIL